MFVMSTRTTKEIFSFPLYLTFGGNLKTNFINMNEAVNFLRTRLRICHLQLPGAVCSVWHPSRNHDDPGDSRNYSLVHYNE